MTVSVDIRKLDEASILAQVQQWGLPTFRARQIWSWIWDKGCTDFAAMTDLPKSLREQLAEQFIFQPIQSDKQQVSSDGTIKYRFGLHDGHRIEAVLIPVPVEERYTVCVSCQVGCSLTCSFCATGRMGRIRNLDAAEIFDQVWQVQQHCQEIYGRGLTNIVYMGMGEPLLTYHPVMESVALITRPDGLGYAPRRITISTAGIAKMIRRLADDNAGVNLALSLHAADDDKRDTIMPINEQNNLAALMEALTYFYRQTKGRITYEYIAFDGFNDSLEDARRLAALTRYFPVRINIIEYNPVEGVDMVKSRDERLNAFAAALARLGATVTVRRSRGKDIDAACGQLANKD